MIPLLFKEFILAVQGVHTCLSVVPHLKIYVKEMIKVVCKDLASGIFNTELFIIANYLILPKYPAREGNGTPLQYSSLENPMDGGAW